jgi:hypothetical protein
VYSTFGQKQTKQQFQIASNNQKMIKTYQTVCWESSAFAAEPNLKSAREQKNTFIETNNTLSNYHELQESYSFDYFR